MAGMRVVGTVLGALAVAGLLACTGDIDGGGGGGGGSDAGGGGGGGPDASAATTDLVFCVDETNRLRATQGKPALTHSAQLEAYSNTAAQYDTQMQSAHAYFKSNSGGGLSFAENECPSFLGWRIMGDVRNTIGQCLQAFYNEGPGGGHYENMMGNYGTLGCGVYIDGNNITIVQDYGR